MALRQWTVSYTDVIGQSGFSSSTDLIQLHDGRLIMAYKAQGQIRAERFDIFGVHTDRVQLSDATTAGGSPSLLSVVALDDGGYLLSLIDDRGFVWEEYNRLGNLDASASIPFTTLGASYGGFVEAYDTIDGPNANLSFANAQQLNPASGEVEVWGIWYNNDTNAVSSQRLLYAQSVHVPTYEEDVSTARGAALSNGNYVSLVRYNDRDGVDLVAIITDENGIFQGFSNVVLNGSTDTEDYAAKGATVTALNDGGYVVTWIENYTLPGKIRIGAPDLDPVTLNSLKAQVFGANGAAQSAIFTIHTDGIVASTVDVLGLADGSFVVAYDDVEYVIPDSHEQRAADRYQTLHLKQYSQLGAELDEWSYDYSGFISGTAGIEAYNSATAAPDLIGVALSALDDGRFAMTYEIAEPFTAFIDGDAYIDVYGYEQSATTVIWDTRGTLTASNNAPNRSNGDDLIMGTVEDDFISRSQGADTVYGWAGNDTIFGSFEDGAHYDGDGRGFATTGTDQLSFISLGTSLALQPGFYTYRIANGVVDFNTGVINAPDQQLTFENIDHLVGSNFNEIFDAVGAPRGITIDAHSGRDLVIMDNATPTTDTVMLGLGNDTLELRNLGNTPHDVDGGGGADWLSINTQGVSDIRVDLVTGVARVGVGTAFAHLSNIENVQAGAGNDTLIGDDQINVLFGGDGDDVLRGAGGRDELRGNDDNDIFEYAPGDIEAGEIANGGSGTDQLLLVGSGIHRFDLLNLTSIEEVAFLPFGTAARVAQFDAGQLGPSLSTVANIVGHSGAGMADRLNITTNFANNIDAGGFTFENWTDGEDGLTLSGNAGANILFGSTGTDFVLDGAGTDAVDAGGGDDFVTVGLGRDSYKGGDGEDTLVLFLAAGAVSLDLEKQLIEISGDFDKDINGFENAVGSFNDDVLAGDDGGNILAGLTGKNVMDGREGFDFASYEFSAQGVTVSLLKQGDVQNTGYGDDVLENFEGLIGSGSNDSLTGDGQSNVLIGNGGNDSLDGGENTDFVGFKTVGTGITATYATTSVTTASFGTDTLTRIEGLRGTDFADVVTVSGVGALIEGKGGADTITGAAQNDTLRGGEGRDRLIGQAGEDLLDGGASFDDMRGGLGDDTYIVDSVFDRIVEGNNAGIDHVHASASYALRAFSQNIENLTLTGGANLSAIGNGLSNVINGNSGNNIINGAWGNDVLWGFAGNDVFYDDRGADNMIGGIGNDVYRVDDPGDRVVELDGEGTDRIESSLSIDLGSIARFVENLTITGSQDRDGTGTEFANRIIGNSGNNALAGALGDDSIRGGVGDDEIDGGGHTTGDTAIYAGARAGFDVALLSDGSVLIEDIDATDGDEGTDRLRGIETVAFFDQTVAIDDLLSWDFAEVGQLSLTHVQQSVVLERTYLNPVVVAFVVSENGPDPVNARILDVTDTTLTLRLQEPNHLDGAHGQETVTYLVMEAGTHVLADGTLVEAGTLQSAKLSTDGFEAVAFEAEFEAAPAILSNVQTNFGTDFVTTRQRNADAEGFDITMQEEQAGNAGAHAEETLGWIAMEEGSGTMGSLTWAVARTSGITDAGGFAPFGLNLGSNAQAVAGLSSFNGIDPGWARGDGAGATGLQVSVEEDTSVDAETDHSAETIDVFAFSDSGTLTTAPRSVVLETGTTTLTSDPSTVTLSNSFADPIVVAFVETEDGADPVNVRVLDAEGDQLTLRLQEPNSIDGTHGPEDVSFVVVEAGSWILADGTRLQADTVATATLTSQGFAPVSFDAGFDDTPLILSHVQTFAGSDFVTTRQQGASNTGFQIAMQEEQAGNSGSHAMEVLGYVAIEAGQGRDGPFSWVATQANGVTDLGGPVGLGMTLGPDAGAVATLSSFDGADPAWVRGGGMAPGALTVSIEEDTSVDAETSHVPEAVDIFAFNAPGVLEGYDVDMLL